VSGREKNGAPGSRTRLPGLRVRDGLTRHPFDLEFGVRTSGLVAGRHLKSGHRNDRHNTAYYAVAPSVFRSLVRRWRKARPAGKLEETTFIDVGAGMGRALLLASVMPFRAVVGIELHPTLARIAKRNVREWKAARRAHAPVRVVEGDALEFVLPEGPLVAFLFNPFGATVMRRLLGKWRKTLAGRGGDLDLLYVNNEQEGVLETAEGWARLFLGKVPRSKADAIADHRIMANQPEGEYASANWEDCSIWRFVVAASAK
jgi:SAM-dependent methyltransferase